MNTKDLIKAFIDAEPKNSILDWLGQPLTAPKQETKLDQKALEDVKRMLEELPEPEFKSPPTLFDRMAPSLIPGVPVTETPRVVMQSVKHLPWKRWHRNRCYAKRIQKKWDKRYGKKAVELWGPDVVFKTEYGLIMDPSMAHRIASVSGI